MTTRYSETELIIAEVIRRASELHDVACQVALETIQETYKNYPYLVEYNPENLDRSRIVSYCESVVMTHREVVSIACEELDASAEIFTIVWAMRRDWPLALKLSKYMRRQDEET